MTSEPFNPLDTRNLGASIVNAFRLAPCHPLPPVEKFVGGGVYAIYYEGEFDAYHPVAKADCEIPIYVGKAEPPGGRSGGGGLEEVTGRHLYSRLRTHARSIDAVENLVLSDFSCKYLIVDSVWIPLGESLLIRHHRPLWNAGIDGFGINTPGKNRFGGARSEWDELHPGRSWYSKMVQAQKPQEVREQVARYFERHPGSDD